MDLLIIDRDETERMGIKWFVKTNQMIYKTIYEAENIQAAKVILERYQPEVVILELELLKQETKPSFQHKLSLFSDKLIAITAEPIFERATEAIDLKASSLLVKPLDLSLLKKALLQVTYHSKTADLETQQLSENLEVYHSLFIESELTCSPESEFLIIQPENNKQNTELFHWLNTLKLPFTAKYYPLSDMIVCIADINGDSNLQYLINETQKILRLWKDKYDSQLSIAIYDKQIKSNSYHELYLKTRDALNMNFYKGFQQIHIAGKLPEFKTFDPFLTTAQQRFWIESLETGDMEGIKNYLYKTFTGINKEYSNPALVRIQLTSILAQLRRFMNNYNLSKESQIESEYHRIFEVILNGPILYTIVQELLLFCIRIIEHATLQKQLRKFDYMERALLFIESNYHNPELSLSVLATYLDLSPNYLSHLLSTKKQTSFKKLLNEIRIKHAKKLLTETNDTVYNISHLVGYNDPSYFTRMFKKHVNLSPIEYRSKSK